MYSISELKDEHDKSMDLEDEILGCKINPPRWSEFSFYNSSLAHELKLYRYSISSQLLSSRSIGAPPLPY